LIYVRNYGWLGLLRLDDVEVYRTGKYHNTEESALEAVKFWRKGHK
jgi:hypothetical protein